MISGDGFEVVKPGSPASSAFAHSGAAARSLSRSSVRRAKSGWSSSSFLRRSASSSQASGSTSVAAARRLAVAQAVMERPRLLLLDEPDSALDLANRSRMTALLAQLVHTGGKTALVCLHDPALALDSCDILVVLQGGGVAAVLHPLSLIHI